MPKKSNTSPNISMKRTHVAVLAMDIVSYSKELDDTQEKLVRVLSDIVNQSLDAHKITDVLKLPTGDGAILVFPGQPGSVALEVALGVRWHIRDRLIKLPVRMGIHEGTASLMPDVAGRTNVVGNAINICARVMHIGDDEHILLSETVYEGLMNE